MKISDNFTLEELTESDAAARLGLQNRPSVDALANITRLAQKLEEVRAIIEKPLDIRSGYRSPEVNKAIGGAERSQHMEGLAADFKVKGMTPYEVCQAIRMSSVGFDQLIHEFGAWTHISIPASGCAPRNMELTYKKGRPVIRGIVP